MHPIQAPTTRDITVTPQRCCMHTKWRLGRKFSLAPPQSIRRTTLFLLLLYYAHYLQELLPFDMSSHKYKKTIWRSEGVVNYHDILIFSATIVPTRAFLEEVIEKKDWDLNLDYGYLHMHLWSRRSSPFHHSMIHIFPITVSCCFLSGSKILVRSSLIPLINWKKNYPEISKLSRTIATKVAMRAHMFFVFLRYILHVWGTFGT